MLQKLLRYFSKPQKQLNIMEALDQSMRRGYRSVNWSNVIWVS